ncbi:hypothetical protein BKA70DRAFT_1314262 [Coprinopsis sp. MPI-PUGE-AT-0042]|nr:hypothetical protein BKA70DRAFT_1314262 [Coprinopsis sp. MPI-PUGE-AT-0042]
MISTQILQGARRGDLLQLRALGEAITRKTYSLEVLQALLDLLSDLRLPLPREPRSPLDYLEPRLEALECLRTALTICNELRDNDSRKSLTIQKISGSIDSLITLLRLCLYSAPFVYVDDALGDYFCSMVSFILSCISLDRTIAKYLLSSPTVIKVILTIWSFPYDEDTDELHDGWEAGESVCIIQHTMDTIIRDKTGFRILCDILSESRVELYRFSSATCTRIQYLGHVGRFEGVDPKNVQLALAISLGNIEILADSNPTIYASLRSCGYLQSSAAVLKELGDLMPKDDGVEVALRLFHHATRLNGNPIDAFEDLFEAGLFHVLVNALSGCRPSLKASCHEIFCRLGSFSTHRRLLRTLRASLTSLSPALFKTVNQRPAVRDDWSTFVKGVQSMGELLELQMTTSRSRICDNETEHTALSWETKACSGCRLSAYCSSACQQQDWKKRHQFECPEMRYTSEKRKAVDFRHVQKHSDKFGPQFQALHPGQPPRDFIVILDARSGLEVGMHIVLRPISKHLERMIVGDCPPLETRVADIISDFRAAPSTDSLLLEMQIAWNAKRGIALLMELKNKDGQWVSGRSVVRFERPQDPQL